jgi:hypothetical protein
MNPSSSKNDYNFRQGCWGLVRLRSLGMQATSGHIVPVLDYGCVGSSRWNENWQGKLKCLEKTCPSATSSTTIST